MTAREIDAMDRRIQANVYNKHGVILTGIGLYSINTGNDEAAVMRRKVLEAVMAHDYAMQFHGFYADTQKKFMSFDVVLSFECDRDEAIKEIRSEIQAMYPDYTITAHPDVDISE